MSIVVLVPGSFLGGWCWRRVVPRLRSAGHEVHTPTLTGSGDRSHLLNSEVGVRTHVKDLRNLLEYADLHDVTLVGHGYGGLVISGVADQRRDRVSRLIYVDGWIPQDGRSYLDLVPSEIANRTRFAAQSEGKGWRIYPRNIDAFHVPSTADREWVEKRLSSQSLKALEEPVRLHPDSFEDLPRHLIHCDSPSHPGMDGVAHIAEVMQLPVTKLPTSHYPMFTMPKRLADLIHKLTENVRQEQS